jgi:hypothetical protein
MPEPATPPDNTPATPAPATYGQGGKVDPVEAAEAHLAKLDMAKQRAIVKNLTK